MQAKKRYVLLVSFIVFVALLYNGLKWNAKRAENELANVERKSANNDEDSFRASNTKSFLSRDMLQVLPSFSEQEYYDDGDEYVESPKERRSTREHVYKNRKCRMESCFDVELCHRRGFKIYVYPNSGEKMSPNYKSIIASIRSSHYYTNNPEQACLYVLSYDTLDRDPLSSDYIHNLGAKISQLKYWNNGKNHIVFNLYSGTWPDYLEDLGFNLGEAILAKASFGDNFYRTGFDISFPLFGKTHPFKQGQGGLLRSNYFPPRRKYLLSFKGKRYTYGIGSSTRNALYHIHNGEDIIMLTTCKHGKNWINFSDDRCLTDNEEYDKWDYQALLHNSTFCMVPRGRRLGSFRFLESLQAACIPVVLANGWMLPFAEIIDWKTASLPWEERLLLQVPSTLREFDDDVIMSLRQKSQFLWEKYFSSVDVIIRTTFEIIYDRIYPDQARPSFTWNMEPGGLFYLPSYSTFIHDYPFYHHYLDIDVTQQFTAVIQATTPITSSSAPVVKLVKTLLLTEACSQIVIIWHCARSPPSATRWQTLALETGKEVIIIDDQPKLMGRRFHPFREIRHNAILSLDEDATLNVQEVDFAFEVWRSLPDRIVGFPARSHFWDEAKSKWVYTSKWSNSYSMVLTGAAFIHRYYLALYTDWLPLQVRNMVDQTSNCEDILMNMLVSHVTRRPPIKVTQKKQYKDTSPNQAQSGVLPSGGVITKWSDPQHFAERQVCMKSFVESFGYMPLMMSEIRFDPALYKDNVSITRKRYPKIEI
ncbi:unnamed protein product [Clavelina lepadiformis]|uniref:Uncharacterized protein n=1 Tax=Clavelina lepadiformis TaxID=159417 RepID=A0ABP0FZD9_CLALP